MKKLLHKTVFGEKPRAKTENVDTKESKSA